jgi:hypothetical protein
VVITTNVDESFSFRNNAKEDDGKSNADKALITKGGNIDVIDEEGESFESENEESDNEIGA